MSHTASYQAEAREFSFIDGMPKRVQKRLQRGVDAFREVVDAFEAAQAEHGLLVPFSTVADSLGVSQQRVYTLAEENRLQAVEVSGRRWVVASSVFAYLSQGPKQAGRPKKLGTGKQTFNVVRELASAVEERL